MIAVARKSKDAYLNCYRHIAYKTLECDQASDFCWHQQELASEFESDLRDTIDWSRMWLVDFNAGKTQLVLFDRFNNSVAIGVKMDGSFSPEKVI